MNGFLTIQFKNTMDKEAIVRFKATVGLDGFNVIINSRFNSIEKDESNKMGLLFGNIYDDDKE